MSKKQLKRRLPLTVDQDQGLRALYRQFDHTTDDLPRNPKVLRQLVSTFNAMTDRSDSPEDVLHYMVTLRKLKQWELLGKGSTPPASFADRFDADDLEAIDAIYEELQIASDNFAFDDELSKKFAREFARRRGRVIPALELAAAVVTRRKGAKLKTLKPKPSEGDLGFNDIHDAM